MKKLIIKPFAEQDLFEAAKWYEDRLEGLGNEFLLAIDAKINAIKRNPEQFPIVYKKIHRALTERFPYGIFFFLSNDTVYVIGVFHTSRNPKHLKKRN